MEEIWKEIEGYDGYYEVSNYGRIKANYKYRPSRILKGSINNCYLTVGLYKNKKSKTIKIHRLVALHFLQTIKDKPFVNHIDCDKMNNKASNLEWCDSFENMKHASINGLMNPIIGEKHYKTKLKEEDVLNIRSSCLPQKELSLLYGVGVSTISMIKKRKNWKYL